MSTTKVEYNEQKDRLAAIARGDEQAFRMLFRSMYPALCIYSEKILKDPVTAEDIVEDVFMKFWQSSRSFKSWDHVKASLYQATYHASLNTLKKSERTGRRQLAYLRDFPAYEPEHLMKMTEVEVFRILYDAIDSLPRQAKKILMLAYMEGKSNQEVADLMELSIHTVKAQKKRAIQLLRERLPHDPYIWLVMMAATHHFIRI